MTTAAETHPGLFSDGKCIASYCSRSQFSFQVLCELKNITHNVHNSFNTHHQPS